MEALLETSSPISIISVEHSLKALLIATGTDQTKEDLKQCSKEKMKLHTISSCNFRGSKANRIGHVFINIFITQGEHYF